MGFDYRMLGVSEEILENSYILQIAVLEEGIMSELEKRFIEPFLTVDFVEQLPHVEDYRDISGLDVRPPDVWRYFVRVKLDVLKSFIEKSSLSGLSERQAEFCERIYPLVQSARERGGAGP